MSVWRDPQHRESDALREYLTETRADRDRLASLLEKLRPYLRHDWGCPVVSSAADAHRRHQPRPPLFLWRG